MEDAATATALGRFDAADRYLSLRAVANYDRPAPGETVHDSFEGTTDSVALARENMQVPFPHIEILLSTILYNKFIVICQCLD